MDRKVANIEHEKNGLYKCQECRIVKPESLFPQHIPTSGKLTRYETCAKCLDGIKEIQVLSGVTQSSRDRNATRAISTQLKIKANLKGKSGFEEYEAECDAANPPKTAQIRCRLILHPGLVAGERRRGMPNHSRRRGQRSQRPMSFWTLSVTKFLVSHCGKNTEWFYEK